MRARPLTGALAEHEGSAKAGPRSASSAGAQRSAPLTASAVAVLQRSAGNRAVTALLQARGPVRLQRWRWPWETEEETPYTGGGGRSGGGGASGSWAPADAGVPGGAPASPAAVDEGPLVCEADPEEENACYPQPNSSLAKPWTCDASCNVEGKEPQCTGRVTGSATGPSEEEACREAKRAATQKAPRGCYARHCQCRCSH